MKELLYLEIPTPNLEKVKDWLQNTWQPPLGKKMITPDGVRLQFESQSQSELSIFVWQVQRTTYLKMFQWGNWATPQQNQIQQQLIKTIRAAFPPEYPVPPAIDLTQQSIFEALADTYPQTVHFFQKMPNGEYDLNRVYWWEKRWRDSVRNPQKPQEVIFQSTVVSDSTKAEYDLIYIGGALGVIHAAVMAAKGYRVLLIERLPFGRMNRRKRE